MSAAALKQTTPEEDLELERAATEKHDYQGGQRVAMAGSTYEHDTICGNVGRLLGNALETGPCQRFTSDMRLYIPATGRWRYPDASVACEPAFSSPVRDMLVNPCVIFEVLSRSTEAEDRGDKFIDYRSIPSFQEYVLISQHRMLVEHYIRQSDGTWNLAILPMGETLRLACAPVEIPVKTIYVRVFPA